jgi:hypothetical protein
MNSATRTLIRFAIILSLLLAQANNASAGEPAWWTQMKADCRNSPHGAAADNYNDWLAQNGCVCNGVGSGQLTCPADAAASGSASASIPTLAGATPEQQLFLLGAKMVGQGLHSYFADRAERARKAKEAARLQQLQQEAIAEDLRKAELSRQRVLSTLKSADESSTPVIKIDDSTNQDIDSKAALIKLADAANVANSGASAEAAQGFDTDGPIKNAVLPDAPSTPLSAPSKSDMLKVLQTKLDQNTKNQKFLDDLQATLKSSPDPDPLMLAKVQEKIDANAQDLSHLTQQINATEQVKVGVDLGPDKKQSP